jgi:outer membrane protein TolC
MPQSPLTAAATLAAVVVASMVAGGAVVAARYQAEDQQQRDLLAASYQQRVALEQKKLDVAKTQLETVQQRVAIGAETVVAAREAEMQVTTAQVQVQLAQLQLQEVQATGKEPNDSVSAPVVSSHDFVRERWSAQLQALQSTIDLEKTRLAGQQRRFNAGLTTTADVTAAEWRVADAQQAIGALQQKVSIRQQFVAGQIDAGLADLRILETDASLRRDVAANQMNLAKLRLTEVTSNFQKGLVTRLDVSIAELRVSELEIEIKKADLDLTVIRQQIAQKKGK